jgi:hypothetical protein
MTQIKLRALVSFNLKTISGIVKQEGALVIATWRRAQHF